MNGLFFIINPVAGNGRASKVWGKVKRELGKMAIVYRSFFTECPGHAEVLARQIVTIQGYHLKTIIGVGGEGTIHEIVNGLTSNHHLQLGFISAGTGNDFARGFQIPTNPVKAVKQLLNSRSKLSKQYDMGKFTLGGKTGPGYFVNNLGVGFDAQVAKTASELPWKKLLNVLNIQSLTYVIALIKSIFTYTPSSLTLTVDEETYEFHECMGRAVSNHPLYGGGMKIAPTANPTDGKLTITTVHNLSRIKLLLLFVTVFFGKHIHLREIEVCSGEKVSITSEHALLIHADGEIVGESPVVIEFKKASWNLSAY